MTENTRIYRDRVLKCITDKPGMVIYRDDIMRQTDLTDDQVMGCLSQLKRDGNNPLSNDIEVVVPGRAWRYVPNRKVQRAVSAVNQVNPRIAKALAEGRPLPLTHRIREFFAQNAQRVVYMDELHRAMNTAETPHTEEQVRVGIANARITSATFRDHLSIVTPGKAWLYDESGSTDSNATATALPSSTTTAPVQSPQPTPVPASPPPTTASVGTDEQMLLLEYLGNDKDGDALYRDDDKNLYRVKRL